MVGLGSTATISSSYVAVVNISSKSLIGGLVGELGAGGTIRASYVLSSEVTNTGSGALNIIAGGLVGSMRERSSIIASYIAETTVSGHNLAGGLVGSISNDGQFINSSYSATLVTGTGDLGGLVGGGSGSISISNSYWNNDISDLISDTSDGNARSTLVLQSPSSASGFSGAIYEDWTNYWCNPTNGELIAASSSPGPAFIRAWDLGTNNQYPALNCTPQTTDGSPPLELQRP